MRQSFLKAMLCNLECEGALGLFSLMEKVIHDESILLMLNRVEHQALATFLADYESNRLLFEKYNCEITLSDHEIKLIKPILIKLTREICLDYEIQARKKFSEHLCIYTGKTYEQLQHEDLYAEHKESQRINHNKLINEITYASESIQTHTFFAERKFIGKIKQTKMDKSDVTPKMNKLLAK